MSLNVDIVTPTQAVFSGEAVSVRVPGWDGEFEILEGHDIVLALTRGGITTVNDSTGSHRFVTGRGFVEAGPDRVTVLASSCEVADQADKSTATADLDASEVARGGATIGSMEWDVAEEKGEMARARLEA